MSEDDREEAIRILMEAATQMHYAAHVLTEEQPVVALDLRHRADRMFELIERLRCR